MSPRDPAMSSALRHPTRVAVLRHLLVAQCATPTDIAAALALPVGQVSYHVRCLCDAGQLTLVRELPRRGAVAHLYRLSDRDVTEDALRRVRPAAAIPTRAESDPGRAWRAVASAVRELRTRREAQGITRAALAARVGITPSQLASVERGATDPRVVVLIRLAHELGVSLGEIFPDS